MKLIGPTLDQFFVYSDLYEPC